MHSILSLNNLIFFFVMHSYYARVQPNFWGALRPTANCLVGAVAMLCRLYQLKGFAKRGVKNILEFGGYLELRHIVIGFFQQA